MRRYLLFHDSHPEFTVSTYFSILSKCQMPCFFQNQSEFDFISEVSGKFEITEDTPMFVKLSFGDEADT